LIQQRSFRSVEPPLVPKRHTPGSNLFSQDISYQSGPNPAGAADTGVGGVKKQSIAGVELPVAPTRTR